MLEAGDAQGLTDDGGHVAVVRSAEAAPAGEYFAVAPGLAVHRGLYAWRRTVGLGGLKVVAAEGRRGQRQG